MTEDSISNEFDDKITKKEIHELVARIRKLKPQAIDDFWFRCGFVFEDRGANKALPQKAINNIMKSDKEAEDLVTMLFVEAHLDDIRKQLADIERERWS